MRKLITYLASLAFLMLTFSATAQSNTDAKKHWKSVRTNNIVKFIERHASVSESTMTEIKTFVKDRTDDLDMTVKTGPTSMKAFRRDVLEMLETKLSKVDYDKIIAALNS